MQSKWQGNSSLGSLGAPSLENMYTLSCHPSSEVLLINTLLIGTPEIWHLQRIREWTAKS